MMMMMMTMIVMMIPAMSAMVARTAAKAMLTINEMINDQLSQQVVIGEH